MTDTVAPPDEPLATPTDPVAAEPERPLVAAPQASWRVGLLTLATGGAYASFWMYGRGRDARALGADTTPWLWFLAPFVSLAMPFALGNLREAYVRALPDHPVSEELVPLGWGIFVLNVAFGIDGRFEAPMWVTLLLMVLLAAAFARLQHAFAAVHGAAEGLDFRGRADRFSGPQVVALVAVGIPLWALLLFATLNASGGLLGERASGVQPLASTGYGFTLPASGWTRSDDTFLAAEDAESQFQGPLLDSWIEVYDYGRSLSLDDVMEYRRSNFDDLLMNAECSEHRRLAPGSTDVVATLRCTGGLFDGLTGDGAFAFTVGVATEQGVAEIVGQASGPKIRMRSVQRELEALADSVGALP